MFGNRLRFPVAAPIAANPTGCNGRAYLADRHERSSLRALATGVALVTSIDTTPAAVVSIYDYARRSGGRMLRRTC
jgi:hypothetical protein